MKEEQAKYNIEAGHNLIFILGIMQRSGTNYLNNLLLLHPDCEYPGFVWEDYLIDPAENLSRYVQSVYGHWHPSWKENVEKSMGSNSLMNCIGKGLNLFMNEQYESSFGTGQRTAKKRSIETDEFPKLVNATPSVKNLEYFFQLFPHASLLIVVRDGRSVMESGMKTFDWDFEYGVRRWMNAAEAIFSFDEAEQRGRYLIVRYEDVYTNVKDTMTRILSFLGIDTDRYDFDAAAHLKVVGSSELRSSEGKVHWKERERSSDFNPVGRWNHWKRQQHERFNWMAGAYLQRFGYSQKEYKSWRKPWTVWNMILDRLYGFECWLHKRMFFLGELVKILRKMVYSLPDQFSIKEFRKVSTDRET